MRSYRDTLSGWIEKCVVCDYLLGQSKDATVHSKLILTDDPDCPGCKSIQEDIEAAQSLMGRLGRVNRQRFELDHLEEGSY